MNISIIGPEESGKSRFAADYAKKVAGGRPVFIIGGERSAFRSLDMDRFHEPMDAVVIVDDANAFIEQSDFMKKGKAERLQAPVVKSRWRGRVNIFVFHSIDDAVKFFLRHSKYVYVSKNLQDRSYESNKYLKGITPQEFGRGRWIFRRYKRG